ncbi:integrase [Embleya sp. NBC_00888]|uniref:integrase n=1 Tax=Embleya sp. NBC_00888 TaxID=2975960 RepID=UPI0038670F33|nr:integrase [Embleya sp. NBC_00888]
MTRWAERHGVARRLADAVAEAIVPENTKDTYAKAWRTWQRFTATQHLPVDEGGRGSLVAFVAWLLREGRTDGAGYAPSSASTILAAVVVGLRERGVHVARDDQAEARRAMDGLTVRLLQEGERRGRGQAKAVAAGDLYTVVRACPDTLAGHRDRAPILTGLHYASRAQDPAGLLARDVALHPRDLVVTILTGKTKYAVCDARIVRQRDAEVCPVRAWENYRKRLAADAAPEWSAPDAPAFVGIDQWGHVTGGMTPDSITRAVKRVSARAGVAVAWTGHSLRVGHASMARRKGRDAVAIADQGGWARHSRSLHGYMQIEDGWDDNSSADLV